MKFRSEALWIARKREARRTGRLPGELSSACVSESPEHSKRPPKEATAYNNRKVFPETVRGRFLAAPRMTRSLRGGWCRRSRKRTASAGQSPQEQAVMKTRAGGGVRFRMDGGICYNRMAVRDAGTQEKAPGDVQGAAEFRSQPAGTAAQPAERVEQEDASRYCPVCSQRLESRRCKLMCNACGYYMSCADYY